MDIKRKIEIVEQSIRSLTTHDDMDVAVRSAALDRIDALIAAERKAMHSRVEKKIKAAGAAVATSKSQGDG